MLQFQHCKSIGVVRLTMAMQAPDPFSSSSLSLPTQLWSGGPSPGTLYHFPGRGNHSSAAEGPITRTLRPMVTGTSVLGVTFGDGVMLAADTLGSYGSLARYRSVSRMHKATDSCVLGATGDFADFQFMGRLFEDLTIESDSLDDGISYTPSSIFSYLTRVMYQRRSRFDPLWNTVIVGGYDKEKKQPFLGFVNSIGTAFEAPTLATGLGGYIAQPLLRDAYEKNPAMSRDEARDLLERCLKVLFYRDCRALNKYELAIITADGAEILGPLTQDTNWDIAHYVKGYD